MWYINGRYALVNKYKNMKQKEKLLISFSGGETSAYLAKWMLDNKSCDIYSNCGEDN